MIDKLAHFDLTLPDTYEPVGVFDPFFGQERFCRAIHLACQLNDPTHHVAAVSAQGSSNLLMPVRMLLDEYAKTTTHAPNDWIYVHNFDNPKQPKALPMPAGSATDFAQQVHNAYSRCRKKIAQHFDTLGHQKQTLALKVTLQKKQTLAITEFNKRALRYHLVFDATATGHLSPLGNTAPKDATALLKPLQALLRTLDALDCEYDNALERLEQNKALRIIDGVFAPLIDHTKDPALKAYLSAYAKALVDDEGEEEPSAPFFVNVINHQTNQIPIIYASHHSLSSLTGTLQSTEHKRFDVSTIKAGLLHRANGGFLLVQASDLTDETWQTLKHALLVGEIATDDHSGDNTQNRLSPKPIPLNVKVVLLCDETEYDELMNDGDARYLFGVRADWAWQTNNTPKAQQALLAHAHHLVDKEALPPIAKETHGVLLTALARRVENKQQLSLEWLYLSQLIRQSAIIARMANSKYIKPCHLTEVINAQHDRQGMLACYYWQELKDGRHLITTSGQAIGQVNALSVIDDGFCSFGLPTRLTAQVVKGLGKADVYDVERVAKLGGHIHAKAVLIMSGFLKATFSGHCPLAFSAYLAFEQNYDHIDGDSATLAQICALLSALAGVAIDQQLAITGSMNQLGQVQAVGGINAKIEGFFRLCQHQGLTGNQGVIIPKANIDDLLLADEVTQAVKQEQFAIYAIDDVCDALVLLTKTTAHHAQNGKFAKGTLFALIAKRLKKWHKKSQLAPLESV